MCVFDIQYTVLVYYMCFLLHGSMRSFQETHLRDKAGFVVQND